MVRETPVFPVMGGGGDDIMCVCLCTCIPLANKKSVVKARILFNHRMPTFKGQTLSLSLPATHVRRYVHELSLSMCRSTYNHPTTQPPPPRPTTRPHHAHVSAVAASRSAGGKPQPGVVEPVRMLVREGRNGSMSAASAEFLGAKISGCCPAHAL